MSAAIRNLENRCVIRHERGDRNKKFWYLVEPAENSGQVGQVSLPSLPTPAWQVENAPHEPAAPFRGQAGAGGRLDDPTEILAEATE